MVRIIAVAGDPGGARALGPVIERLRTRQDVELRVIAYLHARDAWRERGIAFEELAAPVDAAALLREMSPDAVLTSTSVNDEALEIAFIAMANAAGIPSVAVLDFWSNYRLRFLSEDGRIVLPTRIAVMDETACAELIASGFPAERLAITGQPALGEISAEFFGLTVAERASIRAELGVSDKDRLILFASQPLADGPTDWGYTEKTVIPELIGALVEIGRRRGERLHLAIRPHPKEAPSNWVSPDENALSIKLSPGGHRLRIAAAADLVAGMTSVLLVEACLSGCIVASIQPGLCRDDPLPTNRLGASKAIYSKATLEPSLEELLYSSAARESVRAACATLQRHGDAAGAIETLIFSVINDCGAKPPRAVDK